MKTINNLLLTAGLALGINHYANAQSKGDTTISEYSNVKRTKLLSDSVLKKEEYIIEKTSKYSKGKLILEVESKYLFDEKDLGKFGVQKNLLNRKQIDQLLIKYASAQYKYDSLVRVIEIEKMEDLSPGENKMEKSKTYFTYKGKDKTPIKIWDDLNNDGKLDEKDKIKIYVKEVDKWVSQGE